MASITASVSFWPYCATWCCVRLLILRSIAPMPTALEDAGVVTSSVEASLLPRSRFRGPSRILDDSTPPRLDMFGCMRQVKLSGEEVVVLLLALFLILLSLDGRRGRRVGTGRDGTQSRLAKPSRRSREPDV